MTIKMRLRTPSSLLPDLPLARHPCPNLWFHFSVRLQRNKETTVADSARLQIRERSSNGPPTNPSLGSWPSGPNNRAPPKPLFGQTNLKLVFFCFFWGHYFDRCWGRGIKVKTMDVVASLTLPLNGGHLDQSGGRVEPQVKAQLQISPPPAPPFFLGKTNMCFVGTGAFEAATIGAAATWPRNFGASKRRRPGDKGLFTAFGLEF